MHLVLIDSHTHVVAADRSRYPTTGDGAGTWWEAATPAEALVAALDRERVERAVVVQAVGPYAFDNRYALDAATQCPERFVCIPAVDLDASDALETIATLADRVGVAGIRAFAVRGFGIDHSVEWVDDGSFADVLAASPTVVLTAYADQIERLARVIAGHAGTPVAIDHGGFPDWSAGPPFRYLDLLADLPHVSIKVSAHVLREAPDPRVAFALFADTFGPARIVAGTDFPQTSDDYGALCAEVRSVAGNDDDARGFYGDNAARLWFAS